MSTLIEIAIAIAAFVAIFAARRRELDNLRCLVPLSFANMTSTAEEKTFLSVAVAAIPRVAEIILEFPPDDRAGALETAERRFLAAALDHGSTEIAARSRVSIVMSRLRSHIERQRASEKKLQALLYRLTEPD